MKKKTTRYGLLFALMLCFFAASSFAQNPSMSYGEQLLNITDQECMRRVPLAYRAEGFNPGAPSVNTTYATKGIHSAYIRCLGEPEKGRTRVIIVVGSGSSDVNVPGAERVKLQGRMDQSGGGGGTLTGDWDIKCCNDELSWTLKITQHDGNTFSGTFSAESGGGVVTNGQLRGNNIEFDRFEYIGGGWKQHWSAQIVNEGGRLRMTNGVWTGSYQESFSGRNNWHAEKK